MPSQPEIHTVRVWDLPLRLFHWSLVAAVTGAFACAWIPGVPIDWHARFGYAVLALLIFRLLWGLAGGYWSRFSTWRPMPGLVLAYLRGTPHPDDAVGHTPLGTLSLIALLALLAVQVGTGLVSDDEIAFTGPLNVLVSTANGLAATSWHTRIGKLLVLVLVVLHVAAVLYYLLKRRHNLIRPMLHGDKAVATPARASRDDLVLRLWGLLLAAASVGAVWALLAAVG